MLFRIDQKEEIRKQYDWTRRKKAKTDGLPKLANNSKLDTSKKQIRPE